MVTPSNKHQDWFDIQDADIQNRLEAIQVPSQRDAYLKAKQDCQKDLQRMQNGRAQGKDNRCPKLEKNEL